MRNVLVYVVRRQLTTCDSYGIHPVQSFVKTFTNFCFCARKGAEILLV